MDLLTSTAIPLDPSLLCVQQQQHQHRHHHQLHRHYHSDPAPYPSDCQGISGPCTYPYPYPFGSDDTRSTPSNLARQNSYVDLGPKLSNVPDNPLVDTTDSKGRAISLETSEQPPFTSLALQFPDPSTYPLTYPQDSSKFSTGSHLSLATLPATDTAAPSASAAIAALINASNLKGFSPGGFQDLGSSSSSWTNPLVLQPLSYLEGTHYCAVASPPTSSNPLTPTSPRPGLSDLPSCPDLSLPPSAGDLLYNPGAGYSYPVSQVQFTPSVGTSVDQSAGLARPHPQPQPQVRTQTLDILDLVDPSVFDPANPFNTPGVIVAGASALMTPSSTSPTETKSGGHAHAFDHGQGQNQGHAAPPPLYHSTSYTYGATTQDQPPSSVPQERSSSDRGQQDTSIKTETDDGATGQGQWTSKQLPPPLETSMLPPLRTPTPSSSHLHGTSRHATQYSYYPHFASHHTGPYAYPPSSSLTSSTSATTPTYGPPKSHHAYPSPGGFYPPHASVSGQAPGSGSSSGTDLYTPPSTFPPDYGYGVGVPAGTSGGGATGHFGTIQPSAFQGWSEPIHRSRGASVSGPTTGTSSPVPGIGLGISASGHDSLEVPQHGTGRRASSPAISSGFTTSVPGSASTSTSGRAEAGDTTRAGGFEGSKWWSRVSTEESPSVDDDSANGSTPTATIPTAAPARQKSKKGKGGRRAEPVSEGEEELDGLGLGAIPGQVQYTSDSEIKQTKELRRMCYNCHSVTPPSWRKSILHAGKILCNKCGIFERTHHRSRPPQNDDHKLRRSIGVGAEGPAGEVASGRRGSSGRKRVPPPLPVHLQVMPPEDDDDSPMGSPSMPDSGVPSQSGANTHIYAFPAPPTSATSVSGSSSNVVYGLPPSFPRSNLDSSASSTSGFTYTHPLAPPHVAPPPHRRHSQAHLRSYGHTHALEQGSGSGSGSGHGSRRVHQSLTPGLAHTYLHGSHSPSIGSRYVYVGQGQYGYVYSPPTTQPPAGLVSPHHIYGGGYQFQPHPYVYPQSHQGHEHRANPTPGHVHGHSHSHTHSHERGQSSPYAHAYARRSAAQHAASSSSVAVAVPQTITAPAVPLTSSAAVPLSASSASTNTSRRSGGEMTSADTSAVSTAGEVSAMDMDAQGHGVEVSQDVVTDDEQVDESEDVEEDEQEEEDEAVEQLQLQEDSGVAGGAPGGGVR